MRSKNLSWALVAGIFCNFAWGLSFMFCKIALSISDPLVLLSHRFILAFLLMNLLRFFPRFKLNLKAKDYLALIPVGFFEPVVYFICEHYGILLTNSIFSGVMIAVIPVFSLVAGSLFLGERASFRQVLFSMISVSGVIVLALQNAADGNINLSGILLLMGAVISAVAFNILSRKTSQRYSSFERTYVMFMLGAVVFTPIALLRCAGDISAYCAPLASSSYWGCLAFLDIICSVAAYLALNYSISRLPIAQTTAFSNLATVVSVIAGAVFLKEPLSVVSAFTCILIILSVWGVQHKPESSDGSLPPA